jgi:predicted enzyme related to lactoylglutathione lyase
MSTGVATAVGQVVWHTLLAPDVEKAKAFYGQLLGWEYEIFKPGEMDVPMIKQNGQSHGGIQEITSPGTPAHWCAYVQVEDLAATLGRVEAAGGKTLAPITAIPDVGSFAVIADPDGGVIAAFTPSGEMPPPAGTFLWDELLAEDVEGAKRFYTQVFGWTTAEMDVGETTYTLFKREGGADVGGLMQKPADVPVKSAWLTYLATDDVDATAAKAKELGGAVMMEGFDVPNVGRLAVLGDSAHAAFGLFKPNAA